MFYLDSILFRFYHLVFCLPFFYWNCNHFNNWKQINNLRNLFVFLHWFQTMNIVKLDELINSMSITKYTTKIYYVTSDNYLKLSTLLWNSFILEQYLSYRQSKILFYCQQNCHKSNRKQFISSSLRNAYNILNLSECSDY